MPYAGLGELDAKFNVYIANRPKFADFQCSLTVAPLAKGEIDAIGKACGNGWRKVFNVYAKLLFALDTENLVSLQQTKTWQEYRDKNLLQAGSSTSLLFTGPDQVNENIHIVMGKNYAKTLGLSLEWLDNDFAIGAQSRIIVCPYFDYRQLSNIKIVRLVELIKQLSQSVTSEV